MGVDVELMARTAEPLSDDAIAELSTAFRKEFPDDGRWPWIERDEYDDPERTVRVVCVCRYYGIGYERGPWPEIRAMADWLTVRVGEAGEVRCGGDDRDGWDELVPYVAQRQQIEDYWQTYGHRPYHWSTNCDCDHCENLPAPLPPKEN